MSEEVAQAEAAGPTSFPTAEFAPDPPGTGLRIWGWILFVLGLCAVAASWFLPTTVSTDSSYDPTGGYVAASTVSNIGRMQTQMVVLHCGIGIAIIGAIFISAAAVIRAVHAVKE